MSGETPPVRAGAQIARGVSWKLATQVVTQVTRLVVALILARLLAPAEFGIAALALVFTSLVHLFSEFGGYSALIQSQEQTEEDRCTVFWISCALGVVACGGGIILAGPIAGFFGEPQVRPMFIVLSFTFFLTTATTTTSAILNRAMAFRRIEIASMVGVVCGAVAGIAIAFTGGGAWAIILQQVVNSVVYLGLLWFATHWRPKFIFSRASARKTMRFSANLTGAGVLAYVQKNIDNLLIGRFIGAAPLGVYSLSYNLMLNPVTRLADPLTQSLFPVLARIQDDDERIASIWLRATRLAAAIVTPAMVGLVILAPEFVDTVLGPKWADAVPVIQFLSCVGIVYTLNTVTWGVALAKGLSGQLLRLTLAGTAMTVAGILVGLSRGIEAVAAGVAVGVVLQLPLHVELGARALGIRRARYWRAVGPVAAATLGMAAVLVPLRRLFTESGFAAPAVLVCGVAAAAACYIALCLLSPSLRREVAEVTGLARERFRRRGPVLEVAATSPK